MATYSLPTGHQYLEARVNWSQTQNIEANTSNVTAFVEARRTSSYMTTADGYSPKLTFWIDGKERVRYPSYNFGSHAVGSWFSIGGAVSATVGHNNDGTRSINIATLYDTGVANLGNLSKVQPVTLTTIPRASIISGGWNWNAGDDAVISIERKSTDYHHTVYIDVGYNNNYTGVSIRNDIGTSVNANFNAEEQAFIAQCFVNNGNPSDIQSRIRSKTYNSSGVQIGEETTAWGLVHRPPESTITSQASLELTTSGVPYTLNGVFGSKWITHSLKLFSNAFNTTITLANGASNTGIITLTQAQIDSLYTQYTSQAYAPFNIEVTTLLAGVQLGSKRTVTTGDGVLTFNESATVPLLTGAPTYADTNSVISAITTNNQHIVQNKSNLKITIPASSATAKYGATLANYSVSVNGVEKIVAYSSGVVVVDFGLVNATVNTTAQVSVIDSRGLRASKSIQITVFPYSAPTVLGVANRLDGFGNDTTLFASGALSSVNGKNSIQTIQYRYKLTSTETWGTYVSLTPVNNGVSYTSATDTVELDNSLTFNVEYHVVDSIGTGVNFSFILDAGKPIAFMDKLRKSFGVGMFPVHNNSLETAGDAYIGGNIHVTGTGGNVYHTGMKPTYTDVGAISVPLALASNADLNNIQTAGMYHCNTNAVSVTISNKPATIGSAFSLLVEQHAGCKQTFTQYETGWIGMWVRNYYNGTWGEWSRVIVGNTQFSYLSLQNGWQNYNDGSGTYPVAEAVKFPTGLIVLHGLVRYGTLRTNITTLPVGYRPTKVNIFNIITDGNKLGRIDIHPNGEVFLDTGSAGYVSLSGIAFYPAGG